MPSTTAHLLHRSRVLLALVVLAGLCALEAKPPNFVVIVADDLGYGDLGAYGGQHIRTPALDRMAAEGVRLTQFYTPAPTCSPARSALLTGRHPLRTGVTRVLVPKEVQGLPQSEITIAEILKDAGYDTACVGKWHLGGRRHLRPDRQGFDEFFGVLYSNNMVRLKRLQWPRFELFDGPRPIESPADNALLTRRYTQRAVDFLRRDREAPFFLYLAFTMPHVPLAASEAFRGRSPHGLYGDVVEELDASVGYVLATLKEADLASETYVLFTSDNGPWTGDAATPGGSTGGLRGFKGMIWEGGVRIPLIAWAPGRLPAGESRKGVATLLDVFPTLAGLAGVSLPTDRTFDGADMVPMLGGESTMPERPLFFSNGREVYAVRSGDWKLHLRERALDRRGERARHPRILDEPELYQLDRDPGEARNVAAEHPEIVDRLRRSAAAFQAGIQPAMRLRPRGRAVARGLFSPPF